MKRVLFTIISTTFFAGCSVFGIRTTEEPNFTIIEEDGDFQVRQYEDYIIAYVTVDGDYDESTSKGFRKLADYIFGKNQKDADIAMTAPVFQEENSEKMAMTAPVYQEEKEGEWRMSFVMPLKYSMETLPQPIDGDVKIEKVKGKKTVVIEYSGYLSEGNIRENTTELLKWVENNGYKIVSAPRSAGYDPPWAIPFLRRNEVLIDVN
ncbi:MAG: heme-binding protein [Melioribacteraceae bacterium]|nr:heme-binding protein [Melioribacteraceae bacterium]MCF8263888.1 heme-binding protein [Melioribacteraceae bacterium]MCF8414364.1 heme-binding protein [Melioribacteraceae bacterium]MCF8430293.1 heme-binding protein [Melioribacteraceae bacterium]